MDTELRRKFSAILSTYSMMYPKFFAERKCKWQMNTDTVVALFKEAEIMRDANAIKWVEPTNDYSVECLGQPVEIIEKDEINLVIRVA